MYNAHHRSVVWRLLLPLGDLFSVAISFPIAFSLVLSLKGLSPLPLEHLTILNCFFIAVLELFFFRLAGLYRWVAFIEPKVMFMHLSAALLGSTLTYVLLRTLDAPPEDTGHSLIYLPGLLVIAGTTLVLTISFRLLIRQVQLSVLRTALVERVAYIGHSDRMKNVLEGLKKEGLTSVTVVGWIGNEIRVVDSAPPSTGSRKIGRVSDLRNVLESEKINRLIVDLRGVKEGDLERISEVCSDLMVGLMMIPWASDIWADRLGIRRLGGIPLMVIYDLPIGKLGNKIVKRAIDLIGSLVGLILALPVMAVLAVLIKRESPGPVIYRQPRPGYCGKTFQIIKLRSMRLDANEGSGVTRAVADDPRRLKIGEFMRKWNLDELPQFWNVLKGEMSLVGPRPEILDLIAGLRGTIHGYNLRHLCKPGMTGWAAVNGLRGDTSLEDRVKYDLYYIDHWSLMLDLRILLLTLLPPKNAY